MTMKTNDPHGSWRYIIVGFDISNADFEIIKEKAMEAGMSVSAYVSKSLERKDVLAEKNQKMYESLMPYWKVILSELNRLGGGDI